jgi:hypothetical protein
MTIGTANSHPCLILGLFIAATSASGCAPRCPAGQDTVCDGSSCSACGDLCFANSDCPSGSVCACRQFDDGVCVSPDWASAHHARTGTCGGGGGDCGSGCASGSTCVTGMGCRPLCTSNVQCSSNCCASLTGGQHACAPDSSYCSGGCPAGQFPLYAGGPCQPPVPSSCPNDWVVCTCPETHGVWCHAACAFPFCSGAPCTP